MDVFSFDVNNSRKLRLFQQEHDGPVFIQTLDAAGFPEPTDEEEEISPGDFVMLVNYFRYCKRSGRELL